MSLPNPDVDNPVPLSIRQTVLCSGIANGNETHWNFLWQRYLNSNIADEKNTIMASLACSKEVHIQKKFCHLY